MRASTLFMLTVAILLGLGAAVALRMSGLLTRASDPGPAKRPDVPVLVAAKNHFANDTILASGVRVRNMRPEEIAVWQKSDKANYLPTTAQAAALRVAKVNIEADTPITRDMLKDMAKPTALNERLMPDMRAINLVLTKERSAGGLVQVGEWVEVYLTSVIDGGDGTRGTRTATIAPKVRVIAKRDSLWPVFAPLPKDKPIEYTLEVNSYRAALIEFARSKGTLSISPLPQVEQKKLEATRQEKLQASKPPAEGAPPVTASIESAPVEEDGREIDLVEAVDKGELVITDSDLVLLFGIKKFTPPPPPATVQIERISGIRRTDSAVFTLDGQRYTPGANLTGYGPRDSRYQYLPGGSRRPVGEIQGNRPLHGVGPTGGYGSPYAGYGYGPGAMAGAGSDAAGIRFSAPDCPTCKKNKY